ncbi:MAG: hypothetical protein JF595_00430 [Sphingomonadales bacterium]|nr:hypothetical protein [Sphingomonadales bacterium]
MDSDIEHCLDRIAAEESLAHRAASDEAADVHHQVVMLYKAQLTALRRMTRRPSI